MHPIYENIRKRRLELGLNQDRLAEMIGYKGKSIISRIENGKIDLQYSKILAIAEALEISEPELCGWVPSLTEDGRITYIKASDSGRAKLKVSEDQPYNKKKK